MRNTGGTYSRNRVGVRQARDRLKALPIRIVHYLKQVKKIANE